MGYSLSSHQYSLILHHQIASMEDSCESLIEFIVHVFFPYLFSQHHWQWHVPFEPSIHMCKLNVHQFRCPCPMGRTDTLPNTTTQFGCRDVRTGTQEDQDFKGLFGSSFQLSTFVQNDVKFMVKTNYGYVPLNIRDFKLESIIKFFFKKTQKKKLLT